MMKNYHSTRQFTSPLIPAQGFMLLEVLVSVLLFALGVIALVGLQGRSLAVTGEIQYRAEAIHLANAYVAKMWAYQNDVAQLKTQFESVAMSCDDTTMTASCSTGATIVNEYTAFCAQIKGNGSVEGLIPNAYVPIVRIEDTSYTPQGSTEPVPSAAVDIEICWLDKDTLDLPGGNPIRHNFRQVTALGFPQQQ